MIKEIDKSRIPCKRGKRNVVVEQEIADFLASGHEAGEIDASEYTTTAICCATYKKAANRMNAKVDIYARRDHVFIVKQLETRSGNA